MSDDRRSKTFKLNWKQWAAFCREQGIDPVENREHGFDLGGGDSFTVACDDDPPVVGEGEEKDW